MDAAPSEVFDEVTERGVTEDTKLVWWKCIFQLWMTRLSSHLSLPFFSSTIYHLYSQSCCYFDHLTFTIHCMFSLHLKVLYLHNVRTSFLPTSHCCGIQILGMWQFYQKRSHRPLIFLLNPHRYMEVTYKPDF